MFAVAFILLYVVVAVIAAVILTGVIAGVSKLIAANKEAIVDTAKWFAACSIVVALVFAMIFFSMPARAEESEFYPRAAIITELDLDEDLVTCVDAAGCIWQFYGIEDFDIGDIVSMILWNAGTSESIFDDEIIDATYAGTLDQLGAWIK